MTDRRRARGLAGVGGGLLLFPCLGFAYVGIVVLSDVNFPFEVRVFGRRIYELSQLTLGGEFGGLAGVPFVFALGLGGAAALLITRRTGHLTSSAAVALFVGAFYIAALLVFFLMPPIFGQMGGN